MLGELLEQLRRWRRARAAAGDVVERLRQLRELALDETAQLEQDGAVLAQRVRRNSQRGRQLLGGERPL